MNRTIGITVLAVMLTACGAQAPAGPFPHPTICGDLGNPPIRIDDRDCELGRPDARIYAADPAELDYDDFTAVGEVIDDDYLNEDDDAAVLPWLGSRTTRSSPPRTTPRATPSRTAPRATAAAPAPQTRASRPTTTRRTR